MYTGFFTFVIYPDQWVFGSRPEESEALKILKKLYTVKISSNGTIFIGVKKFTITNPVDIDYLEYPDTNCEIIHVENPIWEWDMEKLRKQKQIIIEEIFDRLDVDFDIESEYFKFDTYAMWFQDF